MCFFFFHPRLLGSINQKKIILLEERKWLDLVNGNRMCYSSW